MTSNHIPPDAFDLTPYVTNVEPVPGKRLMDEIAEWQEAIRTNMTWEVSYAFTPAEPVDHMAEAVEYERRWRRATRRLGSLPERGMESHAVFTARGAHDLALKHLIAAINERLRP